MASLEEAQKLAKAARTRYKQTGKSEDLEQMVIYFSDALRFCPPRHPDRDIVLDSIGIALGDRSRQLRSIQDLDDAITHRRESLSLRPPGHPNRSVSLNNLAAALNDRYKLLGKIVDLEDAITHFRESLSLCPPSHPHRSMYLNNVGNCLQDRYEKLGKIEDLEDAVTHYRESVSLCPPGHPNYPESLNNFAAGLRVRYKKLGRVADLEDAITYSRKSLSVCPPGHPNRSGLLMNLGTALHDRCDKSGRIVDLQDAITHLRETLGLCPPRHPLRASSLNSVANALRARYNHSGSIVDLETAITHYRESLNLRPPGHPNHAMSLNSVASALHDRYNQLGRIVDLEDAITYHQECLSLCPPGHQDRSNSLNNIANCLQGRYKRLGRIEDLEDAIIYHRESLSLSPPGHAERSRFLMSLGSALYNRYDQLGRVVDLEDAITIYHESLSLSPAGHPLRSISLNNIANALRARYKQFGKIMDLEHAITHHQKFLSLFPPSHPNYPDILNNFAAALYDRYKQLGRNVDLEDSITHYRDCLSLYPPGHPHRSSTLSNLAGTLLTRYDQTRSASDIQDFFQLIQQAVDDSAGSLKMRLHAAQRWVSVARVHRDNSLLDAYSMIFLLLNRFLILHPNIDSQHKFLASVDISVSSDAASAAIEAGKFPKAIELLEQGRAILWSKMTAYRHPLDELRLADEELADHFAKLSAELEHLALSSEFRQLDSDQHKMPATSEGRWRQMRDLSEKWDEAVDLIRKKEGFSNFLQAVPFETLREAAADGPIIVINVSKYRSDAIIILLDGPPVLVALPDVWPEHLSELHSQLAKARNRRNLANPSTAIYPILRELWANIVSPVLDRLKELGVAQKSRIWWCPTSELCGLPLHAAGPYRSGQRNLPDLYISSYASTLSALINARSNIIRQQTGPKLLVIGQPDETLNHVLPEIENIQQIVNSADVIVGAEASRTVILDGLQQHSWAHFACHGYLGGDAGAFQASFKLQDSHLKLLDLIQARLLNAEFAFLSACHSAAADRSTPNEAISLAAALQFCGFRSVVGTLWAMNDDVGPAISKEFYKHMFRNSEEKVDFRDAAEALNMAIRALRRNGLPLDRWIMFVHIGA